MGWKANGGNRAMSRQAPHLKHRAVWTRLVVDAQCLLKRVMPGWAVELWMFVLVGLIQLALDSIVFVLLTQAGSTVIVANVVGRLMGATSGYLLNGSVTFLGHESESQLSLGSGVRFVIFWLLSTIISTTALYSLRTVASIHIVWLIKPVVEGLLAVLSFLVSKHWIYR